MAILQGIQIKHNITPKYTGITLDRPLTFNVYLNESRINVIQKLAGPGWVNIKYGGIWGTVLMQYRACK